MSTLVLGSFMFAAALIYLWNGGTSAQSSSSILVYMNVSLIFLASSLFYAMSFRSVRVWVISDDTPGSTTKGVYLCTRLQECPECFHVVSRVGRNPLFPPL